MLDYHVHDPHAATPQHDQPRPRQRQNVLGRPTMRIVVFVDKLLVCLKCGRRRTLLRKPALRVPDGLLLAVIVVRLLLVEMLVKIKMRHVIVPRRVPRPQRVLPGLCLSPVRAFVSLMLARVVRVLPRRPPVQRGCLVRGPRILGVPVVVLVTSRIALRLEPRRHCPISIQQLRVERRSRVRVPQHLVRLLNSVVLLCHATPLVGLGSSIAIRVVFLAELVVPLLDL